SPRILRKDHSHHPEGYRPPLFLTGWVTRGAGHGPRFVSQISGSLRYALRQSTLCSKACPIRSRVASSKCRPMNISPTGRPFDIAHEMLSPGCPVMLKGAVLMIISYGASESCRGALIGVVGIINTSQRFKASSYSALSFGR